MFVTDPDIRRALASVEKAVPNVCNDANRPNYHFMPPAYWMNDPNGLIYHDGYYHVFFQHNPFASHWGSMHWGHARSRDLIHWEHLPIALAPKKELGESHCFSGSAVVDDDGVPWIFYTSIGPGRSHKDAAEQWAARGDPELITWQRHPQNPILAADCNGDVTIMDWRDPFVLRHGDDWYLVAGGHRREGNGCVSLYRSHNLSEWSFHGILLEGNERNWECPAFFPLGGKWCLVYSPHNLVRYYIGQMDFSTGKFFPETEGNLDYGRDFYAASTLRDHLGRQLLWGWIRNFPDRKWWNGALSIPRLLSLNASGQLVQRPVPELSKLRGPLCEYEYLHIEPTEKREIPLETNSAEISGSLSCGAESRCRIELLDRGRNQILASLDFAHQSVHLRAQNESAEIAMSSPQEFRMFLDRSIVEIFVGDTLSLTIVFSGTPLPQNAILRITSVVGPAQVDRLRIWTMTALTTTIAWELLASSQCDRH